MGGLWLGVAGRGGSAIDRAHFWKRNSTPLPKAKFRTKIRAIMMTRVVNTTVV